MTATALAPAFETSRRFQLLPPGARCTDCRWTDSGSGIPRRAEEEASGHHRDTGHEVWADQVQRRVAIFTVREDPEVAGDG